MRTMQTLQLYLGKLGPGQVGPGQLGPRQLGPGQLGPGAQLSAMEKWQIGPRKKTEWKIETQMLWNIIYDP